MDALAQVQPLHHAITASFSWSNAIYTALMCLVLGTIIWWKMHLMRLEIHQLVVGLPKIGSEFIHEELMEMRRDLDQARASIKVIEEHVGLNGEGRQG